ncbi:restriction endonuclease subunit S [Sphaerotilus sulfidivorans]|nr:type I restriction-modification protein subunit S [Sphaerotilus natans]
MSIKKEYLQASIGELACEPVEQTGPTSDFLYVDISSIDRETKKITAAKNLTLSQAPSRARQVLKSGDVLVSMTRPNLNAVALVPKSLEGAIGSTGFHVLRSKWLKPEFLFALVQTDDFIEAMCDLVQGALYPAVRPKDISAHQFTFESLAQQTRIVEKLEELLSDLDAGVAELKAAQRKLGQYRQSLLKAAVEGALTAQWRAQHTPTETGAQLLERILTERRARWEAKQLAKFEEQGKAPPKDWRKKYPEPVRPDTEDFQELPAGWVWSSIGQCFQVAVGATPSRKDPSYWGGPIPWVSSGEVRFSRITATKETITEQGLSNSSTQINPIGSVMLGMIGEGKTRGQVAILDVPAANNQNCAAIWASETDIPPEYVYYWLWSQYEETRRGSSGNNQPALNKSIVERISLPIAPLEELKQIVRQVDCELNAAAEQERAIEYALKQSAAQRKNILKAAFSGQLVPQDPGDEPAAVLLERIRAERAATAPAARRGRQTKVTA